MSKNEKQTAHDPVKVGSAAVSALIIVLVLALAALLIMPSVSAQWATTEGESTSGTANSAVTPTGETTSVTVTVEGMSFVPATIEVPVGNNLEVTLQNTGDQRHDLLFENGAEIKPVAPGASATVEVGIVGSQFEGWCTLPGHRQMGMVLDVVPVGGEATESGAAAESSTSGDEHAGHNMGSASSGASSTVPTMTELLKQAEETDPYPAELGAVPQETEHQFTFEVTEDEDALAEGVVRPIWTYNGTSPGPTLHGKVGDKFVITLVNQGTMGHSIDFHAGSVAPDQPMRTIEPGESLVYEFTAHRSGIWMYHCSTMPMSVHIANGMFGAVIIEPDNLPAVDRSYVLIQSEIYLDEAELTAAEKATKLQGDLTAFNGRPFQYDVHPLTAKVGERVRVWVLDIGPNLPLSFHIVGTQFDTVWSEGNYSVYRGKSTDGITEGETGAQVLSLMAAEGGFVEFVPLEAGKYSFVNHIMSLAELGAHGVFQVTD